MAGMGYSGKSIVAIAVMASVTSAIAILSISGRASARSPDRRIAVLEFRWEGQSDVALLGKLSDDARAAAVDVAKPQGYLVMTRENTFALLADMGKGACTEGECEVETARAIGADLVVTGEIVPIQGRLFATLKLHETNGGSLLATADLEAGGALELVRNLRSAANSLLVRGLARPAVGPAHATTVPDPGMATTSLSSTRSAVTPAVELPRGPFPSAPAPPPPPSPPSPPAPPGSSPYRTATQVLVAYDEAVRAEATGEPGPALEAWMRLARMPDPNSYRRLAEERVAWWRENGRTIEAKYASCTGGLDSMAQVIPLAAVPAEDKARMVREFASTHGTRCVARLLPVLTPADRAFTCRALPGEILADLIAVCSEEPAPKR